MTARFRCRRKARMNEASRPGVSWPGASTAAAWPPACPPGGSPRTRPTGRTGTSAACSSNSTSATWWRCPSPSRSSPWPASGASTSSPRKWAIRVVGQQTRQLFAEQFGVRRQLRLGRGGLARDGNRLAGLAAAPLQRAAQNESTGDGGGQQRSGPEHDPQVQRPAGPGRRRRRCGGVGGGGWSL